jgi:branched-chain amino acid aminotransferase
VLWTDSKENKYIEESGSTNVMFVINGTLLTPALSDTILDGVTRDSFLVLAKEAGIRVEERKISVDEILDAIQKNTLSEAFCVGTAAVSTVICSVGIGGNTYELPAHHAKSLVTLLTGNLEKIRRGESDDRFGWNMLVS